jgi:hypothetical protein
MSEAFYSHARLYDLMFPGGGPAVDFYRADANRQGGRWRPGTAGLAHKPGRRQRGIITQQPPDRRDITRANRQSQLDRDAVVARDPLAGLPLTHDGPSCQPPDGHDSPSQVDSAQWG